jgi:tetratricopeptide (TPR) repeat protein
LRARRAIYIWFIKNREFLRALRIIENTAPTINIGVALDSLPSILIDTANWLPPKKYLRVFIDFIRWINEKKKTNLAFNLSFGLAETYQEESEACLVFAQICIDLKLFYLAERYTFKAYETNKGDFRILNCCAIVLIKEGEPNRAIDFCLKAIEISPGSPQSYLNISQAYLYLNELDACEESLNKAVSIDPQYVPALVFLAQFVLLFRKDVIKFLDVIGKIEKIAPHDKWVTMLKYQYSVQMNDPNDNLLRQWLQKCFDEHYVPF